MRISSTNSGFADASRSAAVSFCTTAGGVPFGASIPNFVTSITSIPDSRSVGMSLRMSVRCGPVEASATSLPAAICGMIALGSPITMSTLPPRIEVTAGPMPW